jgi:hypothetical protein
MFFFQKGKVIQVLSVGSFQWERGRCKDGGLRVNMVEKYYLLMYEYSKNGYERVKENDQEGEFNLYTL